MSSSLSHSSPLKEFESRLLYWALGLAGCGVLIWLASLGLVVAAPLAQLGSGAPRREATSVVVLVSKEAPDRPPGAGPAGPAGRVSGSASEAVRRDTGNILSQASPSNGPGAGSGAPRRKAEPKRQPEPRGGSSGAPSRKAESKQHAVTQSGKSNDRRQEPTQTQPKRSWVQRNVVDRVRPAVGKVQSWWRDREHRRQVDRQRMRQLAPEQRKVEVRENLEMGVTTPAKAVAQTAIRHAPTVARAIGKHAPRIYGKASSAIKRAAGAAGRAAQAGGAAARDRLVVPAARAAKKSAVTLARNVREDMRNEIDTGRRVVQRLGQAMRDPAGSASAARKHVADKVGDVRSALREPIKTLRTKSGEVAERIGVATRRVRDDPAGAIKRWPGYARQQFTRFAFRAAALEGARRVAEMATGTSGTSQSEADSQALYVGAGGGRTHTMFTDADGRPMEAVTVEAGIGHSASVSHGINASVPPPGTGQEATATAHWGGTGANVEAFRRPNGRFDLTARLPASSHLTFQGAASSDC